MCYIFLLLKLTKWFHLLYLYDRNIAEYTMLLLYLCIHCLHVGAIEPVIETIHTMEICKYYIQIRASPLLFPSLLPPLSLPSFSSSFLPPSLLPNFSLLHSLLSFLTFFSQRAVVQHLLAHHGLGEVERAYTLLQKRPHHCPTCPGCLWIQARSKPVPLKK